MAKNLKNNKDISKQKRRKWYFWTFLSLIIATAFGMVFYLIMSNINSKNSSQNNTKIIEKFSSIKIDPVKKAKTFVKNDEIPMKEDFIITFPQNYKYTFIKATKPNEKGISVVTIKIETIPSSDKIEYKDFYVDGFETKDEMEKRKAIEIINKIKGILESKKGKENVNNFEKKASKNNLFKNGDLDLIIKSNNTSIKYSNPYIDDDREFIYNFTISKSNQSVDASVKIIITGIKKYKANIDIKAILKEEIKLPKPDSKILSSTVKKPENQTVGDGVTAEFTLWDQVDGNGEINWEVNLTKYPGDIPKSISGTIRGYLTTGEKAIQDANAAIDDEVKTTSGNVEKKTGSMVNNGNKPVEGDFTITQPSERSLTYTFVSATATDGDGNTTVTVEVGSSVAGSKTINRQFIVGGFETKTQKTAKEAKMLIDKIKAQLNNKTGSEVVDAALKPAKTAETFSSGDFGITVTEINGATITYAHDEITANGDVVYKFTINKGGQKVTATATITVTGIDKFKANAAIQAVDKSNIKLPKPDSKILSSTVKKPENQTVGDGVTAEFTLWDQVDGNGEINWEVNLTKYPGDIPKVISGKIRGYLTTGEKATQDANAAIDDEVKTTSGNVEKKTGSIVNNGNKPVEGDFTITQPSERSLTYTFVSATATDGDGNTTVTVEVGSSVAGSKTINRQFIVGGFETKTQKTAKEAKMLIDKIKAQLNNKTGSEVVDAALKPAKTAETFSSGDFGITVTEINGATITYAHDEITANGDVVYKFTINKDGQKVTATATITVTGIDKFKANAAIQAVDKSNIKLPKPDSKILSSTVKKPENQTVGDGVTAEFTLWDQVDGNGEINWEVNLTKYPGDIPKSISGTIRGYLTTGEKAIQDANAAIDDEVKTTSGNVEKKTGSMVNNGNKPVEGDFTITQPSERSLTYTFVSATATDGDGNTTVTVEVGSSVAGSKTINRQFIVGGFETKTQKTAKEAKMLIDKIKAQLNNKTGSEVVDAALKPAKTAETFSSGDFGITVTEINGATITYAHDEITANGDVVYKFTINKGGQKVTATATITVTGIDKFKANAAIQAVDKSNIKLPKPDSKILSSTVKKPENQTVGDGVTAEFTLWDQVDGNGEINWEVNLTKYPGDIPKSISGTIRGYLTTGEKAIQDANAAIDDGVKNTGNVEKKTGSIVNNGNKPVEGDFTITQPSERSLTYTFVSATATDGDGNTTVTVEVGSSVAGSKTINRKFIVGGFETKTQKMAKIDKFKANAAIQAVDESNVKLPKSDSKILSSTVKKPENQIVGDGVTAKFTEWKTDDERGMILWKANLTKYPGDIPKVISGTISGYKVKVEKKANYFIGYGNRPTKEDLIVNHPNGNKYAFNIPTPYGKKYVFKSATPVNDEGVSYVHVTVITKTKISENNFYSNNSQERITVRGFETKEQYIKRNRKVPERYFEKKTLSKSFTKLADTVEEIGKYAFFQTKFLGDFTLNNLNSLRILDFASFAEVTLPKNFKLPSSVTEIRQWGFGKTIFPSGFTLEHLDKLTKIGIEVFSHTNTLPLGFKLPSQSTLIIDPTAFSFVSLSGNNSWFNSSGKLKDEIKLGSYVGFNNLLALKNILADHKEVNFEYDPFVGQGHKTFIVRRWTKFIGNSFFGIVIPWKYLNNVNVEYITANIDEKDGYEEILYALKFSFAGKTFQQRMLVKFIHP